MEKLTHFERLQLAASILPKAQIFELWQNQQLSVGNKLDLTQLYKRHIIEMFQVAELIDQYDPALNRFPKSQE